MRILGATVAFCLMGTVIAKPLATVANYNGKFMWVQLGAPASGTHLAGSKMITLQLRLPQDAVLKKDARGNKWFTVLVADQGADWKWHQTSRALSLYVRDGAVKAGKYAVSLSLMGIPAAILKEKVQRLSVGLGTSGLVKPTQVVIEKIAPGSA